MEIRFDWHIVASLNNTRKTFNCRLNGRKNMIEFLSGSGWKPEMCFRIVNFKHSNCYLIHEFDINKFMDITQSVKLPTK